MTVPQNFGHIEMSQQFHQQIRHLVSCGDREGKLAEQLQQIEQQLVNEVGEHQEGTLYTDAVQYQRSLELAYLRGYMEGPGPQMVDIMHDQHQNEKKAKRKR